MAFLKETNSLFKTKWLELKEKVYDNGMRYIYTHSPWSKGEGVAVLPFKFIEIAKDGLTGHPMVQQVFLGRYEVCPAHSDEMELCAITGGCDKEGEDHWVTATRELHEEGGYRVPPSRMIYLGDVRNSKSSDSTIHMYAVDITDIKFSGATTDGTLGEEGAYCDWITDRELAFCKDPVMQSMWMRLKYTANGKMMEGVYKHETN